MDGKDHVKFCICIEVYRIQLEGRRRFVREHPETSRAWEMPELTELMMQPEIGSVVLHICAFGMVAQDEKGKAPVRKGTRLMSSSGEERYSSEWIRHARMTPGRTIIGTFTLSKVEPRQPKFILEN